ncbi:MAG: sulfatase-like hydrolase/transferase [Planctomycetota bacterium]|jgi:arylsulfatase A-like enzyme
MLGSRLPRTVLAAVSALAALFIHASARARDDRPNVIVILSDDQGYADVSYNPRHSREVSTPHADALARSGIVFTNGYVTGNVCSPTRAGLMTGRYQQRMGIYTAGEGGSGVPLDEVMIPGHLKRAGYVSGAFGKWHMGLTLEYNAVNRGFDEFYGFMGRGAHDYFKLGRAQLGFKNKANPLYRGLEEIDDRGYLTTRITEEAVAFIERNRARPFFAYVAYNAVHAPAQAPEEDVKLFDTGDETRNVLMAMIRHLDAGVGAVTTTLDRCGIRERTLVFYLTDNGGAPTMVACNAPLRGHKHQNYEGGIRVPFVVSWPGTIAAGRTCDTVVSSLDILPTILDVAKLDPAPGVRLDGTSLMPAVRGETESLHEHLCWNSGDGSWAVRAGDWKLFGLRGAVDLHNLGSDIAEERDVSRDEPDKVRELTGIYERWLSEMAEPRNATTIKRWDPTRAGGKRDRKRKKRKPRTE